MHRTGLAVLLALAFGGCGDVPDIVFEDEHPDIVVEHVYHFEEDTTPDVVYITETVHVTETVYVTEEDTTPDIVREFYGSADSLPVLLLEETGEPPMPKKLTDPAIAVATEVNDADRFYLEQGGVSKSVAVDVFLLPTNYIGGLITSNGTDADHDIDIAPGIARSADDTASLRLAAELTKQIDGLWVVGDDQPGLDTGSVAADTLYALWLIKRSDTGVVDAIFSTSFVTPDPTRIPDYDSKRLIAAVMTDGSANIIPYVQSGDYFAYLDEIGDVVDTTMTANTFETGTLSVPPSCLANISGYMSDTSPSITRVVLAIKPKGATSGTFDMVGAFAAYQAGPGEVSTAITGWGVILVDANRQMEYACNVSSGNVTIITTGFNMLTRRDP